MTARADARAQQLALTVAAGFAAVTMALGTALGLTVLETAVISLLPVFAGLVTQVLRVNKAELDQGSPDPNTGTDPQTMTSDTDDQPHHTATAPDGGTTE